MGKDTQQTPMLDNTDTGIFCKDFKEDITFKKCLNEQAQKFLTLDLVWVFFSLES
jgi:hypothetical protein